MLDLTLDVCLFEDLSACFTEHVMDARSGASVSVTKKCSTPGACRKQVGCRKSNNQTVHHFEFDQSFRTFQNKVKFKVIEFDVHGTPMKTMELFYEALE